MKGLIIKDFLNLKRQGKILGIMIIFYVFLAISSGNNSMLGGVIAVLCAILPVTAFSYDERAKWDKYALTMPVSRRDLVISKYLLGLILLVAAFIINLVFNLFTSEDQLKEILLMSLLLTGGALVFLSLILPVLFKFGVEKGRTLMLLLLFVPTGLIVLFAKLGIGMPSAAVLNTLQTLAPIIVLAILIISVALSLKIYAKREL